MRVRFERWRPEGGWDAEPFDAGDGVVIYFAARERLEDGQLHTELKRRHPEAIVIGCSTGGQIDADDVDDSGLTAVALSFARTRTRLAARPIAASAESYACGRALGEALAAKDLAGVLVLSDGLVVNGSALATGIGDGVGRATPIMGGMSGDGALFKETLVAADAAPAPRQVAVLGFYGDAIRIGHGSAGGWDVFGPRRRITRSVGNVLFELDGKPALELYRRYLGDEEFDALPSSALMFPLMISNPRGAGCDLVRTVLAVDHDAGSMTFAGDVPEGATAQLMRGSIDRLAEAASTAAAVAGRAVVGMAEGDSLALLVSCIGRRLLLGQRVTDEIVAARRGLYAGTAMFGFYSYGEFSPDADTGFVELHNQTMTVMTLCEAPDAAAAAA